MSKLSPTLKSLINAPFARPGAVPAPSNIRHVYEQLAKDAASKNVGVPAWLSIATATTMTMNSPDSLLALHTVASPHHPSGAVTTAALMREIGLKCIGFNGVPRTINMLNAFRAGLPSDITSALPTTPTRKPTQTNIDAFNARGFALWKSVYRPFDEKLYDKLADSHPDLPVHILHSEYGALFADPPDHCDPGAKVGRVLTSVVAVACLRSQTGVGPQVLSHVFGLRKAFEDGSFKAQGEEEVLGGEWLAGDEGSTWLLETTDRIVEALGEGRGSSFAQGIKRESKL
ncbi:hypothetical protein CAC42_4569 [Sphaceloma murrayae]|uniref:Dol-P-Man:Man(5)GlcNAc(2)-PP-Dol alpha-1,3-mannosyltransferase n=1 Tax=Sphaceloma murrayae TaxID=2082308 RepID=A0A2K1QNA0_9PEZI|nr:hypothetical protein CAC42_4569 [Sphaceloma murrayae]